MIDDVGSAERELSFRDVADTIRRQRTLILGFAAAGAVLALVLSLLQPDVYRATSEVVLQATPSEVVLDGATQQNPQFLDQQVRTEIAVMGSSSVRDAVEKELGHEPTVTVKPKTGTLVVSVSADADSPAAAKRDADTYASTYVKLRRKETRADLLEAADALNAQITELETAQAKLDRTASDLDARLAASTGAQERLLVTVARDDAKAAADRLRARDQAQLTTLRQQYEALRLAVTLNARQGVRLVSEAQTSSAPVSPTPVRNTVFGLILGLLLGLAVGFARDRLDETVRNRDDLDRSIGGAPVVGIIPGSGPSGGPSARLESVAQPTSPGAEAYRSLRTSLEFAALDQPVRSIQLTSAAEREGKAAIAANLAVSFAATRPTVLIDADLRRPQLHQLFGLRNAVGLTSVLLGTAELGEALQAVDDVPNLWILPTGPVPANPAEALSVPQLRIAIEDLLAEFDLVVIDSPPVLPTSDALVLSRHADTTLVVATAGATSRKSLARALESLAQVEAPVRGVVLDEGGSGRGPDAPGPAGPSSKVDAGPGPGSPRSHM